MLNMLLHHCSAAKLCPTLCDSMDRSMPGSSDLCYFLVFAQIHAHAVTAAIFCHSLVFLPSICPSIRVFSSELALCIRWPKSWSFSVSVNLSSAYSGLISFRIDWFDLLAVQGAFKNLFQHCSAEIESINSSALSLLFGPTLLSVHNYWKNHSSDYTDLCWK